jgi:hypothetical protein
MVAGQNVGDHGVAAKDLAIRTDLIGNSRASHCSVPARPGGSRSGDRRSDKVL